MGNNNITVKIQNWLNAVKKHGKINARTASLRYPTQKALHEAWRNRPKNAKKITLKDFCALNDTFTYFLWECDELRELRKNRQFDPQKCGSFYGLQGEYREKAYKSFFGRAPLSFNTNILINDGELGIKYAEKTRPKIIRQFFIRELGLDPSGDLYLDTEEGDPAFKSVSSRGDRYSSGCIYRKTDLSVTIRHQKKYWSLIISGNAIIDGMVNLYFSSAKTYGDVSIHKATWLVKSRGFNYNIVDGYIAIHRDSAGRQSSYHADTAKKAAAGVIRKIGRQNLQSATLSDIISAASKSNKIIRMRHSTGAGNCKSGTLDFCNRHGIDTKKGLPMSLAAKLLEQTQNGGLKAAIIVALTD